MSEEKLYDVPAEVVDIFGAYVALNELKDHYIKIPFGFRKARRCAIDAEKKRLEFWRKVRELYPELGETMSYRSSTEKIIVKTPETS